MAAIVFISNERAQVHESSACLGHLDERSYIQYCHGRWWMLGNCQTTGCNDWPIRIENSLELCNRCNYGASVCVSVSLPAALMCLLSVCLSLAPCNFIAKICHPTQTYMSSLFINGIFFFSSSLTVFFPFFFLLSSCQCFVSVPAQAEKGLALAFRGGWCKREHHHVWWWRRGWGWHGSLRHHSAAERPTQCTQGVPHPGQQEHVSGAQQGTYDERLHWLHLLHQLSFPAH